MPKIPSDFQNLADLGNDKKKWHSIVSLWDFAVQRDSLWATKASQWPAKPWSPLMVSTMSKIREAWTLANKRSPSVRAKREGAERRYDAGRPASMGPATKGGKKQVNRFLVYPVSGQSMQRQQLHEMTLCAPEELFFRDNGSGDEPAPVFDAADFGPLATGICVMSVNQARGYTRSQTKEEPFPNACAILCACTPAEWANLHASHNRHVKSRFQPQQCTPFFIGTSRVPRQEKCMLLQFGSEYVVINDQSTTAEVKGDIAEFVQISVQCPNFKGTKADDFAAKAKSSFKETATLVVQASNMYKDHVPYSSRPWTMQWKGSQLQREDGIARVPLNKVETVLRRSGLHDTILDLVGDTRDLYDYYHLAPSVTMLEARGLASSLKEIAFGITMRRNGFAIRIKLGTQQQVDEQLKPELHQAMGDSLAALPRVEGCKLMLMGVPAGYSDIDIISNVAFLGATPWKCKPIGTCNGKDRCKVPGKKNVLVIAHSLPPKPQLILKHAHLTHMISIESVATAPRSSWDGWDAPDLAQTRLPDGRSSRTGPNLNDSTRPDTFAQACPDTFGQSFLPRPKAVARPSGMFSGQGSPWGVQLKSSCARGKWADEDAEDCGNDFGNVFDNLDADAEDEDMQTADELPHSKGPPSTLGQSKGADTQSPLQRRMAELEAQKQADKAEMAILRSNTEKQLAALKTEMEATMLDMVNQIGDINSSMKALEAGMHTGLAAQTAATTALGTELRGLLQQLIDQKSAPAPVADRKAAASRSLSRDSRSPRRSKRSTSRRGKR